MPDASQALEMLQQFLSGPDAKEKISQALDIMSGRDFDPGIFSGDSSAGEKLPSSDDFLKDIDPQKIIKIMSALKKCEKTPDPRTDLLRALKPYLGTKKNSRADKAIKIAAMLKYAPMLENLKDLF